jgi:hypothetical protein
MAALICLQDDTSTGSGKREGERRCSMRQYRSQLEQEVSAFLLSWFMNSTILNFVDFGLRKLVSSFAELCSGEAVNDATGCYWPWECWMLCS